MSELPPDPVADELLPLGWRRDPAREGHWIDPSRGWTYPELDALRLARKDVAEARKVCAPPVHARAAAAADGTGR